MYVTVVYYTPTAFNVQGPTNVRIPPDNPGRVTATSLAQAGRETNCSLTSFQQTSRPVFSWLAAKSFTGILQLVFSRGLGSCSLKRLVQPCFSHRSPITALAIEGGVTSASQPGRPRSVCVIESRACHVTSHRVFLCSLVPRPRLLPLSSK